MLQTSTPTRARRSAKPQSLKSLGDQLRSYSDAQLAQILQDDAAETERIDLAYRLDWRGLLCPNRPACLTGNLLASDSPTGHACVHARPSQLPPSDPYTIWLVKAGRGFGKTRAGAERTKELALGTPYQRGALVATTLDDVRDTMIEGESGLLSILRPSDLRGGSLDRGWNRSMAELYLANGTKLKGFSSETPDKLRGPQHHFAWGDEVAAWKDANKGGAEHTTFSNLMLGLRLGIHPELVLTTTPKPVVLLNGTKNKPGIAKAPGTIVTVGTTYDNLMNLAPTFREAVLSRYEGTRLGRQELLGEDVLDVEGAWLTAVIVELSRVAEAPYTIAEGEEIAVKDPKTGYVRLERAPGKRVVHLRRVVVSIDPATTANAGSDFTGIAVVGLGYDAHLYVLYSEGVKVAPEVWASRALEFFDRFGADAIVAESNQGGDMVKSTIRNIRRSANVKLIHAKRGKSLRWEPISALFSKVNTKKEPAPEAHLVGEHPMLEEQMTTFPTELCVNDDVLDAVSQGAAELLGTSGSNVFIGGSD